MDRQANEQRVKFHHLWARWCYLKQDSFLALACLHRHRLDQLVDQPPRIERRPNRRGVSLEQPHKITQN